jgi:hypothetical protein
LESLALLQRLSRLHYRASKIRLEAGARRMGLGAEDIYGEENVNIESQLEYTPYTPEKGYGWAGALPVKQGLYDPSLEKDACGVGFAA